MAKSWGCNSGVVAAWLDELETYSRNREISVASLSLRSVGATIYKGSPDTATPEEFGAGFTLVWTDYVANDWAETYEVAADAVLRMGLIAACQDGGMFTEEADTPHKWAEQAMHILAAYTTGREDDA